MRGTYTQVYATDGDDMLGGSDFDICLGQHITHHIAPAIGAVALDRGEHRFKRFTGPAPPASSSSSLGVESDAAATRPRIADVTITLQEQTNDDASSSHPLGKTC